MVDPGAKRLGPGTCLSRQPISRVTTGEALRDTVSAALRDSHVSHPQLVGHPGGGLGTGFGRHKCLTRECPLPSQRLIMLIFPIGGLVPPPNAILNNGD